MFDTNHGIFSLSGMVEVERVSFGLNRSGDVGEGPAADWLTFPLRWSARAIR